VTRPWVVDVDLEAFFDRVQHDTLMARIARRVDDKRLLRLPRRYLRVGVMSDEGSPASEEGTPQGSPISPLLANVMLDDLDAELERRGHRFVRSADDPRVYVASERAGQRVMASISTFIEQRLKLRVNRHKSAVARAVSRPFLGFGFVRRGGTVKIGVSPKSRQRAKDRLRELTGRTWGVPMERRIHAINRFTVGWTAYFALAEGKRPFRDLDEWLRRRLRQVRWKEWKRGPTRARNLRSLGVPAGKAHELGQHQQGTLADRRFLDPLHDPDQGLLDQPRPPGIPRSLPPFPGCNANRRMRTRMSGGVRGAGVSPAPTRLRRSPAVHQACT
jgi:RNA-directed DNA polymerase